MRAEAAELGSAVGRISRAQLVVLGRLGRWEVELARRAQEDLDPDMAEARATWPFDPIMVNLAAYHAKNGYMIRHWAEIQAGRAPDDDLLGEAERRFLETLGIDPTDPSALNGLGTVLFFERDLDGAEFFIRAALRESKRRGIQYPEAEADLALVRRFKRV
jgi:hypothetical protein